MDKKRVSILLISLFIIISSLIILGPVNLETIRKSPICQDLDGDGFESNTCGGLDCVDSLMSQYTTQVGTCNEIFDPTFLKGEDRPETDTGIENIADHTWIRDSNEVFHLFFENGTLGMLYGYSPYHDIVHYTSNDLESINRIGPVLIHEEGTYYEKQWAPTVIEDDGIYYMFYTGVETGTNPHTERIGLARSTDLNTWTRYSVNNCPGTNGEGCVYECDELWTSWGDNDQFDDQCRDPMIYRDEQNNRWLMFVTTRIKDGTNGINDNSNVVTIASSTDLINWQGIGYIKDTGWLWGDDGTAKTKGGIAENAFLIDYNGNYYLFFTDWFDIWDDPNLPEDEVRSMVQYVTSDSLTFDTGGSLNWVWQGHIQDPGVNAIEIQNIDGDTYIMSQRPANSNSGRFDNHPNTHWGELRLKRIIWNDDLTFNTSKITRFGCRTHSFDINPNSPELCGNIFDDNCDEQTDEYCQPPTNTELLFRNTDVLSLQDKLRNGEYDQEAFNLIISNADLYLTYDIDYGMTTGPEPIPPLGIEYDDLNDISSLETTNGLGIESFNRIPTLAIAYQLSEYENPNKFKYRDKCKKELINLSLSTDVLDVTGSSFYASMRLYALTVGFDMCFDSATNEEINIVKDEISSYLERATAGWPDPWNKEWSDYLYIPYTFNKGIMAGSVIGMAAYLLDGKTLNQPLIDNSKEMSEQIININLNTMFEDTGAYKEGVLYVAWSMRFLSPYIETRKNFGGTDLSQLDKIKNIDEWLVYGIRPNKEAYINNLNDALQSTYPLAIHNTYLDWAQSKYNSRLSKWLWNKVYPKQFDMWRYNSDHLSTVLWNNNVNPINPKAILSNSKLFPHRGLYYFRTGWPDPDQKETLDTVFSFYAGKWWGGHSQEDQGQFTLWSKGENFITDTGITLSEVLARKLKSTRGHNLILIDNKGQHFSGSLIGTDGRIVKFISNSFSDYILGDIKSAYDTHSDFNNQDFPYPGKDWSWGYKNANPVINADRHVVVLKNRLNKNLLVNPGFETDIGFDFDIEWLYDDNIQNNLLPDGWKSWILEPNNVELDNLYKINGDYSVKITADDSTSFVVQQIPVEPEKSYKISGWIKTELTQGFGIIATHPIAEDRNILTGGGLDNYNPNRKIRGNTDWTYFEFEVKSTIALDGVYPSYLQVECYVSPGLEQSSGDVWCDDFRVEEINNNKIIEDYFVIVDDINKDNSVRNYKLLFHTEVPNTYLLNTNPIQIQGTKKGNNLEIFYVNPYFNDLTFSQELMVGEQEPDTTILLSEVNSVNPYFFYTLYPKDFNSQLPNYNILDFKDGYGVEIKFDSDVDIIAYNKRTPKGSKKDIEQLSPPRFSPTISASNFKTDSKVSVVRLESGLLPNKFLLSSGTNLEEVIPLVTVNKEAIVSSDNHEITISNPSYSYQIYGPKVKRVIYNEREIKFERNGDYILINKVLNNEFPEVFLDQPMDKFTNVGVINVNFECSATDDNSISNIKLLIKIESEWKEIYSVNSNQLSYTFRNMQPGNYKWNCLAYDNSNQPSFATENKEINIQSKDKTDGRGFKELSPRKLILDFIYNLFNR